MSAAAVAAIIEKVRDNIVSFFLSHNAVTREVAVCFTPRSHVERKEFTKLQQAGVLKPGPDSTFYLDAPVYSEWRQRQRQQGRMLFGSVLAIIALGAGIGLLLGS